MKSDELRGAPSAVLYVRGNWCPFCTKQVAELTRYYREINELGARLIFLTPEPLETTRRVAEFFDVDFEFWLDKDLQVARQLGLLMSSGVTENYRKEYGADTAWPMALVIDADGVIRYARLSRLIVDRPNPKMLVAKLRDLSG